MAEISIQRRNGGQAPAATAAREIEPFRFVRDLLRWDPFREMTPIWSGELATYAPSFEVKETKDAFVFKADVPGVKESDLELTVAGARLTVSGKREAEREEKDDTFYTYERSYGTFTRTFTLPDEADAAHVQADLKGGVLTIVVPKSAAAVAKRIPIAGEKVKS